MIRLLRATPTALLITCLATSTSVLASEQLYNQISLRAEAHQEVAHDQMEVTLYSDGQDTDPARLAKTITQTLNKAVETARQQPRINVKLGSRSSYPVHDSKGQKITAWRERAELRLESTDFSELSALTGELLKTLKMANMQFSIAPKTRISSEDELLKEAISAFQARADLVSKAFGSTGYKVVNLNLNSSGFARPPMYARGAKMLSASMSEESAVIPEIEAGSSQVSIIADGVIEVVLP
ncbi:MAG TPA: SIMPL domain-containing protein [Thiopseudomonas sp.]|nr:SIMPL domain-containing protein [Thiopseudomonas sp.]